MMEVGNADHGPREVEVKFRLPDQVKELRERLIRLGARSLGEAHELDVYLDLPAGELTATDRVLRLRRDTRGGKLTYKGPSQGDAVFSDREEIEVKVADVEALETLLGRLGYRPGRRKEKYREPFVVGEGGAPNGAPRGVMAFLDRLPFLGWYMELEGSREAIAQIAARLGLDLDAGIGRSYLELYREYWVDRGVAPARAPEMLFANEAH